MLDESGGQEVAPVMPPSGVERRVMVEQLHAARDLIDRILSALETSADLPQVDRLRASDHHHV